MVIEIQWTLIVFSLLVGLAGGLFAFVGLATLLKGGHKARFISTIVSIVLLLCGGFASVAHLANPQNVMAAATNIFSFSGISIELILLGICLILMIAYLIVARDESDGGAVKAVAVLGLLFGILLGFFVGHGYVLIARPAWDTETLPLAYLGSSLAAGGLLYVAIAASTKPSQAEIQSMRVPIIVVVLLSAVSLLAYVVAVGFGQAQESNAVALWGGVVLCGIILTLACGFLFYRANEKNIMAVSCIGVVVALVGGLSIRVLMWSMASGYLNFFENIANALPF